MLRQASPGVYASEFPEYRPLTAWQPHQPVLPAGTIVSDDFRKTKQYAFASTPPNPGEPVLTGRIHRADLQNGMLLHASQVRDLQNLSSHVPAAPGLRVIVLLAGSIDVTLGPRHFRHSCMQRNSALGLLIHTTQEEIFQRRWYRGKFERKVYLHLSSEWLASQGLSATPEDTGYGCCASSALSQFLQQHLAVHSWRPSPRAVALAEQLLQPPQPLHETDRLLLASRALELMHEGLRSLDANAPAATLSPRNHLRLAQLRDFLGSSESVDLSLEEIARQVGMSCSALQRQFRAAFGHSVAEYRREAQLQHARHELECRGSSVAEVARNAGYTSSANFATAFKRRFGLSPKQVRARI